MAIEIMVKCEDGTLKQLSVRKDKVTIGRSKKCTLQLNDPMLSGNHCAFFIQDNHLVFKDLGSTNGSFLNSVKMYDSRIYVGDIIRVGRTEITLIREKLTSKERIQHTRDTPQTQITFIKFHETKASLSTVDDNLLSKSDVYQAIDPYNDPYNDPNSLLNKRATTIFKLEKRKTELEQLKRKKQKEDEKKSDGKLSFLKKIFKRKK